MGWAAVGLFIWARADGDVDAYAGPAGFVSSLIQSSGDSVQGQVFFCFRFACYRGRCFLALLSGYYYIKLGSFLA